jgi:hypothetical protein
VTGFTSSRNFPTSDALQPTVRPGRGYGDGAAFDAFLTKFNAPASALLYSTYFGGSGLDQGVGLALDSLGNAYMTGNTFSNDFPTLNPLQATKSGSIGGDAFVVKISSASGGPRPVLNSISPSSGAQGAAVNVTVSGANFSIGSTEIQLSRFGIAVSNINVSGTAQLTATFSITASAPTGPREITVTTPGGVSNRLSFTVVSTTSERR